MFNDTYRAEGKSAYTSRESTYEEDGEPTEFHQVKSFLEWLSTDGAHLPWDQVLRHPMAEKLVNDISEAIDTGLDAPLYRGQRLQEDASPPVERLLAPTEKRLPDDVEPGPGRYNEGGEAVLYTCRKREIVPDEVPPGEGKPELYLVEFDVTLDNLIAIRLDETTEEEQPHLHHLLFLTEYPPKDKDLDVYRATHLVREICRRLGIEAVEYPSVKGGYRDDREALNLVVFEAARPRVEDAVDKGPYEL